MFAMISKPLWSISKVSKSQKTITFENTAAAVDGLQQVIQPLSLSKEKKMHV